MKGLLEKIERLEKLVRELAGRNSELAAGNIRLERENAQLRKEVERRGAILADLGQHF